MAKDGRAGFITELSNVKKFNAGMSKLMAAPADVPKMGLVYGTPGFGKTRTIAQWSAHNKCCLVRAKAAMGVMWLLQEIIEEFGEQPGRRTTMDMFNQARDLLLQHRMPLFVDDMDHLCRHGEVIETLRDLHDTTGVPVLLVGMDEADKKLKRYRHLYDRLLMIQQFTPLTEEDVTIILGQRYPQFKFDAGAVKYLHQDSAIAGKHRRLVILMEEVLRVATANGVKEITASLLGDVEMKALSSRKPARSIAA